MTVWLIAAAYLIGSIPFALLVARHFAGVDVRTAGSGNVGAANVMRTTRPSIGIAVALLDVAKGSLAVWVAAEAGAGAPVRGAAALAAVIGHVYPVWLRFRGGKGVAVAAGAFAIVAPLATAGAVAVFGAILWATRYVSLGSIVAALALPALIALSVGRGPSIVAAMAVAALIVFRHRGNVRRLLSGTERRLGEAA